MLNSLFPEFHSTKLLLNERFSLDFYDSFTYFIMGVKTSCNLNLLKNKMVLNIMFRRCFEY